MTLADGYLIYKHMMGRHVEDLYPQSERLCHAYGIGFPSEAYLYHYLSRIRDPLEHITVLVSTAPPSSLFETEHGVPNSILVLWRTSTGGGLAERAVEYQRKYQKIAANLLAKGGLEHLLVEVIGSWARSKIVPTLRSFDIEVAYRVEEDAVCSWSHNQMYENADAFTDKIRRGLSQQDGVPFLLVIGTDGLSTSWERYAIGKTLVDSS